MALPSVKNATFTIKVQEFQKPLKIRPMILAEHKAIQMATDVGSESDVVLTIANVAESCTDGLVTAKSVPHYLLEYIFLQLYISSVENVIASRYRCYGHLKNEETGEVLFDEETGDAIICDNSIEVKIPLERANIIYPEDFNELKVIKINDTVKLHLKCLSLHDNLEITNMRAEIIDMVNRVDELSENAELTEADQAEIKLLTDSMIKKRQEVKDAYLYFSVNYIEDAENIYKPEVDFNHKEFLEWAENCPSNAFINMETFYKKIPTIGMDLHIVCPKCGNSSDTVLRGLKDFFS